MAYDLTGQKFGRLTVIELAGSDACKNRLWRCRCDCGTITVKNGACLRSGDTRSCGCLQREETSKRMTTHGHNKNRVRERLYGVWAGMMTRTSNPNSDNYQYYGGRGISVCDEWRDYESFRGWALANGYNENAQRGKCTLDRIDTDKDYCPDNCRWVDMNVQANNMRSNRLMEYNGEVHNMKEWATILGINYSTFKAWTHRGLTIEDMLLK